MVCSNCTRQGKEWRNMDTISGTKGLNQIQTHSVYIYKLKTSPHSINQINQIPNLP